MKILILCTHLNPGGISRYAINLAIGLTRLGHLVWVGAWGGEWVEELEEKKIGFVHIPIDTKSIVSPKVIFSFVRLSRFVRREHIEVVHCNTRVTQMLGFLIWRWLHIPYISAFHGFYKANYMRKKIKLCGLRTIAVSKSVGEHLVKDLGIDPSGVHIIYNGIDAKLPPASSGSKHTYGFSDEDFLIGILGRISEEKGHMLAVQAFAELAGVDRHLRLLVSGTGRLEKTLKEYIDAHGLNACVRFLDVPAPQFLSLLDLLLVPSYKEGFGFAVIEAFAAGIPVIGFNTGGLAEIIRDKENGLLFYEYTAASLAPAIERLRRDEQLRKKIVQQAKVDVLQFSIERMAKATQDVYREVIR
jgi:glycosyltransferase involved in cell wall biosynthesis